MESIAKISVVIPCFRVRAHILNVIQKIGPEVSKIYVVDDCCPENSGRLVAERCADPRVAAITTTKTKVLAVPS